MPPAASTSIASSVAPASSRRQRRAQRLPSGRPEASAPPTARAIERLADNATSHFGRPRDRIFARTFLTVSVTGAAAMTPAASGVRGEDRRRGRSSSSGVSSGRAASWIATQLGVDRGQRVGDGLGAGRAAVDGRRPSRPSSSCDVPAGDRDHDAATGIAAEAGVEGPGDHRPPSERHERLRAAGSEALPGTGGRDDCGHLRPGVLRQTRWRRSAPPAARRGIPRRRPRPCRGRT